MSFMKNAVALILAGLTLLGFTAAGASPYTQVVFGDVDGDGEIGSLDAAAILRHDVGLISLGEGAAAIGDLNADGVTDTLDAVLILKYDVGLISTFPLSEKNTVKFYDWDGTILKIQFGLNNGDSATPPADPVREGYVFAGWDLPLDNVTENLSVNAMYAPVE